MCVLVVAGCFSEVGHSSRCEGLEVGQSLPVGGVFWLVREPGVDECFQVEVVRSVVLVVSS